MMSTIDQTGSKFGDRHCETCPVAISRVVHACLRHYDQYSDGRMNCENGANLPVALLQPRGYASSKDFGA